MKNLQVAQFISTTVDGGDIILQKQLLIETDNPKLLKVQVQN